MTQKPLLDRFALKLVDALRLVEAKILKWLYARTLARWDL